LKFTLTAQEAVAVNLVVGPTAREEAQVDMQQQLCLYQLQRHTWLWLAEADVTLKVLTMVLDLYPLLLVVEHHLVQTLVITVMVVKVEVFQDSLTTVHTLQETQSLSQVAAEPAALHEQEKETLVEQVAVLLLKTVQPHMMVNQSVAVVAELNLAQHHQTVVTLLTLRSLLAV
jgi:hypothetical protein